MKKKEEDFMNYLAEGDDDPIFRFTDEFELVQVLGEGAFGLVIAAKEKYSGVISALKVSDLHLTIFGYDFSFFFYSEFTNFYSLFRS